MRWKKCYFSEMNICVALKRRCNGYDDKCSFRKSKSQYWKDWDKAVDTCRERGICASCKYAGSKCLKSTEDIED